MSEDTPALSDIHYDDLRVGEVMGPYSETVTRELAGKVSGPIGEPADVEHAPPSTFPILFLRALRRAMGGIPAGSILAKQELEFHAPLPVDSEVIITTWVGEKLVKRGRPFVTIEFDIRDTDDTSIVTGRKIIVWPTGPAEAEGEEGGG